MALRMQSLFMLCGFFFANSFVIQAATIKDIQHAFSQNQLTSRQLVDFYLHQIQALNPKLHGVIEVNPDAGDEADKADSRMKSKTKVGELNGIPVVLKDYSINTKDRLNTTAGSYALLGAEVSGDAAVVERLRNAGAVILGKASTSSEWVVSVSFFENPPTLVRKRWTRRSWACIFPFFLYFFPYLGFVIFFLSNLFLLWSRF